MLNKKNAIIGVALLLVALSGTLVSSVDEAQRWYVEMVLLQPRDAVAAGAHIYVYDNYLSSSNPDSFVAFRIAISRYDAVWHNIEWLEVGWFKEHIGFYIYSARSILGEGYTETHWTKFNGERASGESYFDFSIAQVDDPNTFRAYMFDPIIGIWSQMQATFTISGDNLWLIGSESNDPLNTLNGHYASIWYSKNDNLYPWSDIKTSEDVPYHVYTVSSNEFFSYSGYGLGIGIYPATSGGTGGGVAPRKK